MTIAIYLPNGREVEVLSEHQRFAPRTGEPQIRINAGHGPVWCPAILLEPAPMHLGSEEE